MHPTLHSSDDARWMRRALDLAQAMRGHVWPNPPVGCVIVKNGICIGEGATQPGGRPHAERVELDIAGEAARGATLYVTLEPCCHWGHTSPCADAIIMAGIIRVVASQQDPDPRVNGGGFRQLAEAGIDVAIGEGAKEAACIMMGFLHRVHTGTPHVTWLNEPAGRVPDGEDALLMTQQGLPTLVLTTQRTLENSSVLDINRDTDVLAHLGQLGLTSVAIYTGDPFAVALGSPRPLENPL
ncbi:bifunctional diaminohydroxyphosphoribosylaminopyrimidine deaminase/5-amino-6-(5-phosphoribosylamino)uracil reductase RibD [Pseudomonas nabeulensis]|uniref:Bifunctional diaminohydroxyphosphoribosylaminopyrimidine deaminase/5-amino-6-(5-phosphoribosylamino)uracil reductase RibD n=1 Tax=Pseudomonas nabeulensis TaxID=2293833 RepID=A0A4Z0B9S2_9PSED|nr:bifunctional diaminohydroxyphosphoribosylaminopyrimidine deaminase/5-amino-6-(5-phosphoribosylamino)uracil reductase RibD [Pseudomonas nabeulensis]TFY95189.1 bifunctional diaminohydroxyphosphoribosylaminopyrimidine deaminase/5-amino-6-(5-phosphoribosylamino)uracil reductase RibD [Pseudomonas nabeulensis]